MEQAVQRYEPENFVDPGPIPVGEVPNLLAADSQAEAEEIAIDAGFRIRFEGIDDWRPAGRFLEQRPAAGGRLPLGNVIIVEVSNGQGDLPTVPGLRGLTLDDAADRLFAIGYDVGRRDRITDDEAQDGLVIGQSQPPGTPLRPGDGVMVVLDVGVYQEPEPEPEPEPEEPPAEPDPDDPDDGDGNDSSGGGPSDGVGNSRAGGSGDGNGG
jgi:beta-lactam-binding protein with PASTA domain